MKYVILAALVLTPVLSKFRANKLRLDDPEVSAVKDVMKDHQRRWCALNNPDYNLDENVYIDWDGQVAHGKSDMNAFTQYVATKKFRCTQRLTFSEVTVDGNSATVAMDALELKSTIEDGKSTVWVDHTDMDVTLYKEEGGRWMILRLIANTRENEFE